LWTRAQERRDARERDELTLTELIVEIHTAHSAYGAERVTSELKRNGFEVGRRRVARFMREQGIAVITRRKRRNLTRPGKATAVVEAFAQTATRLTAL
jgi:transposase InsO family protein